MRRLRKNGKSLRVIRDALNAKGLKLSHVAVRRVLDMENDNPVPYSGRRKPQDH
jgi:hypothetical protein